MPNVPNPYDFPEVWETMVLRSSAPSNSRVTPARTVMPGIVNVDVRGGIRETRQDAPAENGARAAFLGYRDAEIKVVVNAATKAEFDALVTVITLYRTPKAAKGAPLVCDVAHPQFTLYGIKSAYIYDFEAPDFNPETGYTTTFYMREYTPEAFKATKAVKLKGGKNSKDDNDRLATPGTPGAAKPPTNGKPTRGSAPTGPAQSDPSRFAQGYANGSSTARALVKP